MVIRSLTKCTESESFWYSPSDVPKWHLKCPSLSSSRRGSPRSVDSCCPSNCRAAVLRDSSSAACSAGNCMGWSSPVKHHIFNHLSAWQYWSLQACQISKHCRLGDVLNDSHHGAQLAKDSFGFFNHKIEQKNKVFPHPCPDLSWGVWMEFWSLTVASHFVWCEPNLAATQRATGDFNCYMTPKQEQAIGLGWSVMNHHLWWG